MSTPRLCVEFPRKDGGSDIRLATSKEIAASKKRHKKICALQKEFDHIEKELDKLREQCKHTVIHDEEGWPENSRRCHGCGRYLGQI